MRILLLTPWYPDSRRAHHGIFIREQAQALARRHEVVLVSAKVDYSARRFFFYEVHESESRSVREYQIVIKQSWPLYNQLNFFLVAIRLTWRVGRRFRPDILHGHVGYPTAFWSWVVARLLGIPYVITEHTALLNNFRSPIHKRLTIFGLRRAAARIAVSRALAREVELWTLRPVAIIPNVVDVSRFAVASPVTLGQPQLGFLGGLDTHVKGLDILLNAIARLKQDVVLHVGGDGALLGRYRTMARELGIESKCRFYGSLDPADVPAFMQRLHFFVCSSRYETFGVALVEAMATGLPVVSTRCGGPEDFIDGDTGLLANAGDASDLADKIEWMIAHRQQFHASDLVRRAFDYSAEKIVQQLDDVYHAQLS